jgi:hypothetical protein
MLSHSLFSIDLSAELQKKNRMRLSADTFLNYSFNFCLCEENQIIFPFFIPLSSS